jgi:abortive infection bacteriophage resistance protein
MEAVVQHANFLRFSYFYNQSSSKNSDRIAKSWTVRAESLNLFLFFQSYF